MIGPDDLKPIVYALQEVEIRPTLALCVVLIDTEDGTVTTTAPGDTNVKVMLELALKHHIDKPPHAEFDIHPVS
jgi:hypothetical protein